MGVTPEPAANDGGLLFEDACLSLDGLARLAARLARALRPHDLVLLEGPLGSGKTAFVRELARGLGLTDPVRSPSFTLANVYAGPVPVNHLDLYRLEGRGERDSLVLSEYREPGSITIVEWPAAGHAELGKATFVVEFDHDTPETRRVRLRAGTPEARERWERAR